MNVILTLSGLYPIALLSQTFNGVGNLPFPPSGTVGITTSVCGVSGVGVLGGCNTIANVTIDLNHQWTGDIALILIAPDGTFIELSSGNGGAGDNYTNTVFTDAASSNIVTGSPPFTGQFKPEGRQNVTINNPYPNTGVPGTFTFQNTFNGIDVDGTWTLYLNDYVAGDIGFLNSWSITFSNGGPSFSVNLGPDQTICSGQNVTFTATNTAPSPTGYLWSNGATTQTIILSNVTSGTSYSVTVTDQSGCTGTDAVNIAVTATPTANPVSFVLCEVANGQAVFNLTNANGAIGNGTINWYSDAGLTNPIANPSAYQSGNASVYATVTSNGCTSLPATITLEIISNNPGSYGMDIVQSTLCGMGLMTVQFTLPSPGVYTYNYNLLCGGNSSQSSITTSANPIYLAVTQNCTLEISSITSVTTGCSVTFSPPLTDNIVVQNPPDITVTAAQICAGESINLSNFVSSDQGAVITFHSSTPPNAGNQLGSSIVSPATTTTYYVLSSLQGCSEQASLPVQVLAGGPTFTINTQVCAFESPIALNPLISPPGITGTWSGTGVNGNFFTPENLTGNIVVTFTPTSNCYEEGTVVFTVLASQQPTLLSASVCESATSFDLTNLEDPSFPDGTWSGPGVTGDFFFPSSLSGIQTLTFQGAGQCVQAVTTSVTVIEGPDLVVSSPVSVCSGGNTDLSEYVSNPDNLAVTYYSALPLLPQNQLGSSVVSVAQSTSYFVKLTDANSCFSTAEIVITALPSGTPSLGSVQVCQSEEVYDLTLLEDGVSGPGIWQGAGVSSNLLYLENLSGNIAVTFVPNNSCFTAATTNIDVTVPSTPVLSTLSVCSGSGFINLSTIADPLFPDGFWTGPGVNGVTFNPSNFSGAVSLTFTSSAYCVNPASTTIEVTETQFPDLRDTLLCIDVSLLDLSLLLDPIFVSGEWSGQGVSNNQFSNPGVSGNFVMTFISDEFCVAPSTAIVAVSQLEQPVVPDFSVCGAATPIDLTDYADPDFPNGSWNGQGVAGAIFQAVGLEGVISLTFTPNAYCSQPAVTNLTILGLPEIDSLVVLCQPNDTTYTVGFTISGGDPGSYTVNGLSAGMQYTSSLIQSGTPFSFAIADKNNCGTITVNGSKNCDCTTDAGTIQGADTPLRLCTTEKAIADHKGNQALDANDKFLFILHQKVAPFFGSIVAVAQDGVFSFQGNMKTDSVYFMTAICGDSLSNGLIDLTEACFSYSASQEVIFYKAGYKLSGATAICALECNTVSVAFEGIPPFTFSYTLQNENGILLSDTLQSLEPKNVISFCPGQFGIQKGVGYLQGIFLRDANCVVSNPDSIIRWNINPERKTIIKRELCDGETLEVNGKTYSSTNPTGIDTIQSTIAGQCDSLIFVTVKEIPAAIFQINRTLCETSFLDVNGTIFSISNPSGSLVLPNASRLRCDSIIRVSLSFEKEKNTKIEETLCSDEFKVVNGVRYDKSRPSGTERIVNGDGKCDSVITIRLQFFEPVSASITDTLCPGESLSIGSEVFNQSRPNGLFFFKNATLNGCDSLLRVALVFKDVQIDSITFSLVKGRDTVVYNTLFSASNPRGLVSKGNDPVTGCEQFVFVQINFIQDVLRPQITINGESCPSVGDGYIGINFIEGCSNYTVVCGTITKKITAFPASIGPLLPGRYELSIIGDFDCLYQETVDIPAGVLSVRFDENPVFEAGFNEPVPLLINWTGTPTGIKWTPGTFLSCDNCLQPVFTGSTDQAYEVSFSDVNGCVGRGTVEVNVRASNDDILVPNIISLTSDGANSLFTVQAKGDVQIRSLTINDRWGNRLFTSKGGQPSEILSWDGSGGTLKVTPGVYMYLIETFTGGKEAIRYGNVTVIH